MKHHTAVEYGVTVQGLKGALKQMINDYSEIKTMVHTYTTDQLLKDLTEIELNDTEYTVAVMAELCERGGLDMADYKDFDDCYNAILHEFDVRNGEEK